MIGAGSLVGFAVIAYAFLGAEFVDGPESSAIGDHVRMVLVGVAIIAVGLTLGLALRHGHRWATYVFLLLGALLALAAIWWAAKELLG
ncbi:hypothetical protein Dac01nite_06170 [Demequina activiva]|uniref:Uncharacterized protein n=1 Tax=Demequina activiva TaxID=1582364 RepID=A0A919Q049_9MICO|nr:hypothetical protein Dac01nite_06170 [Demequina activiva]